MEARTEALAELNDEASALERDLHDMTIENEVEDELNALKKQIEEEAEEA
jgi:hypothetical protein